MNRESDSGPRTVSMRADPDLLRRLEQVARLDRRNIANVLTICVEEYLPVLEKELGILAEEPAPYRSKDPKKKKIP